MNGVLTIDPCAGETACLVPPAEFVRLRYFFGQRLGVIELADEQSYLVGKQRFHNLLGHGVGVLCGLRSTRYVFPQSSPPGTATTLLRVSRGAALDGCGREIVVGWDQCIDVAAWFLQHPAVAGSAVAGSLRLWVALCYRECPSDPSPAPRDPCGCDTSGCEFARIREGFELRLLTDEEAEALMAVPVGPDGEPSVPPRSGGVAVGRRLPRTAPRVLPAAGEFPGDARLHRQEGRRHHRAGQRDSRAPHPAADGGPAGVAAADGDRRGRTPGSPEPARTSPR